MKRKRKGKQLTRRQMAVIEDLFNGKGDESLVLAKHELNARVYRKWVTDPVFIAELESRIESSRLQGRLIIARYVPLAALKLVELTEGEKEETARKACIDIISLPETTRRSAITTDENDNAPRHNLSQEMVGDLLRILSGGNS
jgi:hypothetical protein